jgi:hypothetical protein
MIVSMLMTSMIAMWQEQLDADDWKKGADPPNNSSRRRRRQR